MNVDIMRHLAKKTFIALQNPYHTVVKVYPQIIDKVKNDHFSYIGVKDRPEIPDSLVTTFESTKHYGLHTVDAFSLGGRAIDTRLRNPITGRPMTGSSSGTAINVLTGINDLGIGTDGGGSVLAPAMSLNLFGFISPSICKEHTSKFRKYSTDAHAFTPSIGFITREFDALIRAIEVVIPVPTQNNQNNHFDLLEINGALEKNEHLTDSISTTDKVDLNESRELLIPYLEENLGKHDCIISKEGPVDFQGLGDTVLGHMGPQAKEHQHKGNKGLIRVANMAGAAAVTIPTGEHATSYVLLCKDTPEDISRMLAFASDLANKQDPLLKNYFMNFSHYFSDGFKTAE
ncbi:Amidase [Alkalibacterium putridalgicola]|uniref:Amidase n=1 Tax=Alkalibacterium putridalgicola TaxID=426703 RepID=A0A1H7V1N0_9LACT|nr:amidase family protein [Alkalibacterium putridalgicola]GEK89695.1 hypothetical protein APU01nite_17340 [Alkalibacterium putridalgicola]SEM02828.1 Amidase [Alkalibacterium putridalgicola]